MKYKWFPSPSYTHDSHRVDAIILHTTEGATTNDAIKNYLTGHNGVSYHGSVDNQMADMCYEYVLETDKSWSCCNYNGSTLNYVFCTPSGASANWSRNHWLDNQALALKNMAAVVADQAKQWNVPLKALSSSQVQSGARGIAQHMNLGSDGCGHSDCGQMPIDEIIRMASSGGGSTPAPTTERHRTDMPQITDECQVDFPTATGAKNLRLSADVGGQGLDKIEVRVAMHNNGTAGWTVKTAALTPASPIWVSPSMSGHDCVSLNMQTKGAIVGTEWGF